MTICETGGIPVIKHVQESHLKRSFQVHLYCYVSLDSQIPLSEKLDCF